MRLKPEDGTGWNRLRCDFLRPVVQAIRVDDPLSEANGIRYTFSIYCSAAPEFIQ